MKKNTIIILLLIFSGLCLYALSRDNRPNNQYELFLKGKYYVLKDGSRIVDSLKVGTAGQLDSLIKNDNR